MWKILEKNVSNLWIGSLYKQQIMHTSHKGPFLFRTVGSSIVLNVADEPLPY